MADYRWPDSPCNIAVHISKIANQVGYNEAGQYDKNRMVDIKANGIYHYEYDYAH